jgi:hypothetical protein
MALPVRVEPVEARLKAISAAHNRVILSANYDLKQRKVSSRRNLAAGWGVNSILSTTGPLGGE